MTLVKPPYRRSSPQLGPPLKHQAQQACPPDSAVQTAVTQPPSSELQREEALPHLGKAELPALLDVLHPARGAHHDVHTLPQLAQLLADGRT